MKNIQSSIIQATLINITDTTTGESFPLTRIIYTINREDTDNVVGPAIFECYKIGNHIDLISKFTIKYQPHVQVDVDKFSIKNSVNYNIHSINGVKLR